jgi:hypothetical protein
MSRSASITIFGIHRIKRCDRFIGQQNPRLLHQRARDRHALLLPAGQRIGAVQRQLGNTQPVQSPDRQRTLARGEQLEQRTDCRDPVHPAGQHIGQHIQPRNQVELLEDHRRTGAPVVNGLATERGNVAAIEQHPTGRGLDQPVHHPQQRGFSGAGAADDAHHLAGGDAQ